MAEIKKYSTVFIDWSGTLSSSKFWGHWEDSLHKNHNLYLQIQQKLFQGDLKTLLIPWMKGECLSEEVISELARSLNVSFEILFEEFIQSCQQMQFDSKDIMSYVKQLQKKDIKVVIATDNMDSFSRWTVPSMKLHKKFDDVLNSHNLGALKKDFSDKNKSLFFNDYFEATNTNPTSTILIDDSVDKEDRLKKIGINYLKVESGKGIVPALKEIVKIIN